MNHFFDINIAIKYGQEEAIIFQNLFFWIEKNKANNKHFYNGAYWTYNTVKAFEILFPYWSSRQIDRILSSLEKQEAIITGNFNENPYDRTKWYSITEHGYLSLPNGEMHFTKRGNGITQTVKSIHTDINTYINNKENIIKEKVENLKFSPDTDILDLKKKEGYMGDKAIKEKTQALELALILTECPKQRKQLSEIIQEFKSSYQTALNLDLNTKYDILEGKEENKALNSKLDPLVKAELNALSQEAKDFIKSKINSAAEKASNLTPIIQNSTNIPIESEKPKKQPKKSQKKDCIGSETNPAPSIQEILAFIAQFGGKIEDAEYLKRYYEQRSAKEPVDPTKLYPWIDGKGNKVFNWKLKIENSWSKNGVIKTQDHPIENIKYQNQQNNNAFSSPINYYKPNEHKETDKKDVILAPIEDFKKEKEVVPIEIIKNKEEKIIEYSKEVFESKLSNFSIANIVGNLNKKE